MQTSGPPGSAQSEGEGQQNQGVDGGSPEFARQETHFPDGVQSGFLKAILSVNKSESREN
jgi:hypothetical protein